ncbi:MAG: 1-deoxy-D-xylulose-5-phosphate reductoisomerase [Deltaproteobacteria bacterium]|jgi:1-deoxy-D-xylulose-5-phosphate reductoisomerase|nr:1-deoxy-D-xylulose-5-phosphate reductoisomerase [Deltaproteobacteria bacterium]
MTDPIKLAVLGSTGSVGRQALSLAEAFPEHIEIVGLAAAASLEPLAGSVIRFKPKAVSVLGPDEAGKLAALLKARGLRKENFPEILSGEAGAASVAAHSGAAAVLSAMAGAAGLKPTWAALKAGLKVALANKESLVLAGELIRPMISQISPADSEHSAVFQALGGKLTGQGIRRLILTASGGPFLGWTAEQLRCVTREMALNHPRWSMGPKISCDSATLMNKGLEVIEAHHLFGIPYDLIEVLVHPQSAVHSLVEFVDGSQLAQLGPADMRLSLAYSLSHPARWPVAGPKGCRSPLGIEALDLTLSSLTFAEPDRKFFRGLALAEEAGRRGGTAPAIMNGANEEAVRGFLTGRIPFVQIIPVVEECLNILPIDRVSTMEGVLEADKRARLEAGKIMERFEKKSLH